MRLTHIDGRYGEHTMTYDFFLIAMLGVIIWQVLAIGYQKLKHPAGMHPGGTKYSGHDRRAQKRTAGALHHLSDGKWKFR